MHVYRHSEGYSLTSNTKQTFSSSAHLKAFAESPDNLQGLSCISNAE